MDLVDPKIHINLFTRASAIVLVREFRRGIASEYLVKLFILNSQNILI